MRIIEWLKENRDNVDWNSLFLRWERMQTVHNPYRNKQIETIYHVSGVDSIPNAQVLDLGCGPGSLAKCFLKKEEDVEFTAIDIDPFLLAIFENTIVSGSSVAILRKDIRDGSWFRQYEGSFDAVISLTSLHWLSQNNQKILYRRIYSVLKDGGVFANGDPYLPTDKTVRSRLALLQKEKAKTVMGETWDEYWESIYSEYHIKDLLDEAKQFLSHWEDVEGSDDGYTIDFYLESLREAGFKKQNVYWKGGLRIVYGGIK